MAVLVRQRADVRAEPVISASCDAVAVCLLAFHTLKGRSVYLSLCVRATKGLHSACQGSFTVPYVPLLAYKLIHLMHRDPQREASVAGCTSFEPWSIKNPVQSWVFFFFNRERRS